MANDITFEIDNLSSDRVSKIYTIYNVKIILTIYYQVLI